MEENGKSIKSNRMFKIKSSETLTTDADKKTETEGTLVNHDRNRNSSSIPLNILEKVSDKSSSQFHFSQVSTEKELKYAPDSLWLFSSDNKFRLKIQYILSLKIYSISIHTIIIINSVFLIFETIKSLDSISTYSNIIFTVIFLIEFFMKVIAYGFILEDNTYLRDPWNWLDFIVVITGVLSFLPSISANLLALRTFRLIRPLKSISFMPNMRLFITTLINSIVDLGTVFLMMIFFCLIFAILGLSLWSDRFHYKCRTGDSVINGILPLNSTYSEYLCGGSLKCDYCINSYDFYPSQINKSVIDSENNYEKLNYGITNFDNIAESLFVVFLTTTSEGWTNIMNMMMDGYNYYVSFIYFFLCVIVNYYFMLNLTVAVLLYNFERAKASEFTQLKIAKLKERSLNKRSREDHNSTLNSSTISNVIDNQNSNEEVNRKKYRLKYIPLRANGSNAKMDNIGGIFANISMPKLFEKIPMSSSYHKKFKFGFYCYYVYKQPIVQFFFYFCILLNSIILMLDRVNISQKENNIIEKINTVLVSLFTIEIAMLLLGVGVCNFIKDLMNIWDFIIVLVSLIEIIIKSKKGNGSNSVASIFRMLRVLRVFKLFRSYQNFQVIMESIIHTVRRTADYILLFILFIYMYTLLGYSCFNGKITGEMFNFDTFIDSFVCVFQIIIGDHWYDLFYRCYRSKNGKVTSYVFFITLIFLGNITMINIFLAYLINNFQRAKKSLENNLIVKNYVMNIMFYCSKAHEMELRQIKTRPKQKEKKSSVKVLDKCLQTMLNKQLLSEGFFVLNGRIQIDFFKFDTVKNEGSVTYSNPNMSTINANSFNNQNVKIIIFDRQFKEKHSDDANRDLYDNWEIEEKDIEVDFWDFGLKYKKGIPKDFDKKITLYSKQRQIDDDDDDSRKQISRTNMLRKYQSGALPTFPEFEVYGKKLEKSLKRKIKKEIKEGMNVTPIVHDDEKCYDEGKIDSTFLDNKECEGELIDDDNSSSNDSSEEKSKKEEEVPKDLIQEIKKTSLMHMKTVMEPQNRKKTKSKVAFTLDKKKDSISSSNKTNTNSSHTDTETNNEEDKAKIQLKLTLSLKVKKVLSPIWNYMKHSSLFIFHKNSKFRKIVSKIAYNKLFGYIIYLMIIGNCIMMCFDNPWIDPDSRNKKVLDGFNIFFNIVFIIEGVIKIIADDFVYKEKEKVTSMETVKDIIQIHHGSVLSISSSTTNDATSFNTSLLSTGSGNISFSKLNMAEKEQLIEKATQIINRRPAYLRDISNLIDFICIIFGIVDMSVSKNLRYIRVLRVFRAIKPIRLFAKSENLNIMVKSLIGSLPALGNVLLVCGLFIFIFALLGVNLFKSTLQYFCTDLQYRTKEECLNNGLNWYKNSNNFDNFIVSLKTNFEIMLADGWGVMMGKAGTKYKNLWVYWYYFLFIIIGNLFIINLFISVVIQKFNILKERERQSKRLTEPEKEWMHLQKMMLKFSPKIILQIDEENSSEFKKKIFNIVKAKWFDNLIIILICLSLITLIMQYNNAPDSYILTIDCLNYFFTFLFNIEIVMKIYVCGKAFFYFSWNIFDFFIIIACDIMAILSILEDTGHIHIKSLSALPIILRSFRILRVLRLLSTFSKLRALIDSLTYLVPNVLNIGILMFMLILIYANIGMNLFGQVPYRDFINHNLNFRNFIKSSVLLFEVATKENWNDIMYELAYHDCRDPTSEVYQSDSYCFEYNITCYDDSEVTYASMKANEKFSCGNNIAYIYFISFVIIGPMLIMNLCIVMVIEGFSESMGENEGLITVDYMDKFIQIWLSYDRECRHIVKPYEFVLIMKEMHPPIGINYDGCIYRSGLNKERQYKKLIAHRKLIDLLEEEEDEEKSKKFYNTTKSAIEFKEYYMSRDKKFFTTDTEVMNVLNKLEIIPTEIKKQGSFWNKMKHRISNIVKEEEEDDNENNEAVIDIDNDIKCQDRFLNKQKEYYVHFVDACLALSRFAVSKMRNVSYEALRLNIINSYTKKYWVSKYKSDIEMYSNAYLENKKIKEGNLISVYMATNLLYRKLLAKRLNEARLRILEKIKRKEEEKEMQKQREMLDDIGSIIKEEELDIPQEKNDIAYNHNSSRKEESNNINRTLRKKGSGQVGNMGYFFSGKQYSHGSGKSLVNKIKAESTIIKQSGFNTSINVPGLSNNSDEFY